MTSVEFDLNVTIRDERTGKKEVYDRVGFRFTTKSARALERSAGTGIGWLIAQGRSVEALVLMLCYGMQHSHPKMTEDKAVDLIDAYIDRQGNTKDLTKALSDALRESGVYGRDEEQPASPFVPTGNPETAAIPVSSSEIGST